MPELKRQVDTVTLRPSGITFKGKRFGLSSGCWIVSRAVASLICTNYCTDLPSIGYDRMLDDTGYNYVTNIAGAQFRVSLRGESYDCAPTGKFA